MCSEQVGTKIAFFKHEGNHTLAAGLIALLFNPEARAQESPAQKTNISVC
jgi:hypothetical protein